jgi:rhodanese-related sulfurtransferase/pimeloyl-ACP methyl ester carboxylesterase
MGRGDKKYPTRKEKKKMTKKTEANIALLAALLALSFLASTISISWAAPHTDISVTTAWNMMTNGTYPNLLILDVRNQSEYVTGYIPKATLIPLWQLEQRIGELASYKNSEILVYCRTGGISQNASIILDANGFTKVYDMTGGLTAWNSSGYPISTPYTTYLETAGYLDGAHFIARFPNSWNGMLAIICRGFSITPITNARSTINGFNTTLNNGFAIAASTYGADGYCVKKGMNATYQLTRYVVDTYHVTGKVFLIGISMGGNIALLLGEKYPNVYSGVLDMYGTKDLKSNTEIKIRWMNLSDAELITELTALSIPIPPNMYQFTNLSLLRGFCALASSAIAMETGGTPANASKAYEDISPVYHANISIPVISVHGTSDAIVPYYESIMYKNAVASAGHSNLHRLYPIVGGQHANTPVNYEIIRRFIELVLMSNDTSQVTLDISAFQSVTVMPGWTWWFFAHNKGGSAPYAYQWYEGISPIQGQTSSVLAVAKSNPGRYELFCRVTDRDGTTTTSNAITLTVLG